MKKLLLLLLLSLLSLHINAQNIDSKSPITIKLGLSALTSYGIDYQNSTDLSKNIFVQPGIQGGIVYKNDIYFGIFGSKNCRFNSTNAHGVERDILAYEVGIPIKRTLVGLTFGSENYLSPNIGWLTVTHQYRLFLMGAFVDFRLVRALSFLMRTLHTIDNVGSDSTWHISFGISYNFYIKNKTADNNGEH